MNKTEALSVLHEIAEALRESGVTSGVSIDPSFTKISKAPEGFTIKMLCDLDIDLWDRIQPVLEKHKLGM